MHLFWLFFSFVTNINLPLHMATYAVSTNIFFKNNFEEAFRSKRPTTLVLSRDAEP